MKAPQNEVRNQAERSLQVVRDWLARMHDEEIAYCHFKSNAEVAAGLSGVTDMDMLIDRRQHLRAIELLSAAGFKRFKTAVLMDYPAVDDYLAWDAATGKLVHMHLHWEMTAGEPYLKGYRLPWEAVLLEQRSWDADNGIFTASPEAELLLLLTRASLKLRGRDRLRALLGRRYPPAGLRRECDWLLERIDHARSVALAERLYDGGTAALLAEALARGRIDDRDVLAFRRAALPRLRSYRSYGAAEARLRRWSREVRSLWGRQVKRWHQPSAIYRRSPATGGLVVALLGVDGAGKSTQAREVVRWLRWKVDVLPLYLGSGDGPSSLPRRLLSCVAAVISQLRRPLPSRVGAGRQEPSPAGKPLNEADLLRRGWRTLFALALAYERLGKLRKAFRARNRGMIVVADRFPQTQVAGYNDGPLLDDLAAAAAPWRSFARLERWLYDRMALRQPDLVIKLVLDPERALERKPSTPPEMAKRKAAAVARLEFPPATRVVTIDASGSPAEVSLAVKRAVWDEL